jgi:hypothetical protein
MALRMGVQLGIFTQISQNPEQGVSLTKISEDTGASPILVGEKHLPIRPSLIDAN